MLGFAIVGCGMIARFHARALQDVPEARLVALVSRKQANAQAVDKPIAGLLADLKQRGLLESTLVVWGGDFGRTPITDGQLRDGGQIVDAGALEGGVRQRHQRRPRPYRRREGLQGNREAVRWTNGFRTVVSSYADIYRTIGSVTAYFQQHGIRKSDRVLIWADNRMEWVAVFWACIARGAEAVPIDFRFSRDLVERIKAEATPKRASMVATK